MPQVDVIILNANGLHCLPRCIDCVKSQTFQDFSLTVVDNASTDGSVTWLEQTHPEIRLIGNEKNVYFCEGHNVGIRNTRNDYLLLLNYDIFLMPDYLENALETLVRDPRMGGVQGRIWKISSPDAGFPPENDRWIDTTGILLTRSRRNFDANQEQKDDGRFSTPVEIFGPDGCAPLYRRAMLEDIRIGEEYFDADFLMYREVVDLSWRARSRGWSFFYEPSSTAFHVRRFSPRTRSTQSVFFRRLSYRNRYLTLIKNETWSSFIPDAFRIIGFEIAMLGHIILKEPLVLTALIDVIRQLPRMIRKRRWIRKNRTNHPREMRRFLAEKSPRLHFQAFPGSPQSDQGPKPNVH